MNISLNRYWDLLTTYIKPQWPKVLIMSILLLCGIGLQLVNPQVMRAFIDEAQSGHPIQILLKLALLFIGVALVTQAVSVATTYMSERIGWLTTNALRGDLALHCLQMDMDFHNTHAPGEMIERIDGDMTVLAKFFSEFVINLLGSAILLVGVLVALFREDWRVGVALSLFAVLALAVLNFNRNNAIPAVMAEREAETYLFGFLEERLSGIEDIRSSGAGSYVMLRFYQALRDRFTKAKKSISVLYMNTAIIKAFFALGYVAALAMGAYLFYQGSVTLGTIYLFYQYVVLLRNPLEQITSQVRALQRTGASIRRIEALYNIAKQVPDPSIGTHLPTGPLSVQFDHVHFSYHEDEAVITDLSFNLQPGKVLGLLGRTGSGKTTIARLLCGLYSPIEGSIRLSEMDIAQVSLDQVRSRVGIVTQNVQLFQGTVRDNLTFFNVMISDDRIMQVIQDLDLMDWYKLLPAGLDTGISSLGSLSAGEAQLLAFARIFLRDSGLVILDEASSRLDPATERLIGRAVDRMLGNCTCIMIAHRLETLDRVDEILILEQGHIAEYGARDALVKDPDSRYSQLRRTGQKDLLV